MIAWMETDWTFGMWDATIRAMLWQNGVITPLTSENRRAGGRIRLNNNGIVGYNPRSTTPVGIWLFDGSEHRCAVEYRSLFGLNDRGDIAFIANLALWLKRDGLYYKLFSSDEMGFNYLRIRINNRGEAVTVGAFGSPEDIFLARIHPLPGDCDDDWDRDLADVACLQTCFTGDGGDIGDNEVCRLFDFDDDQDVDLADFSAFESKLNAQCLVGFRTAPNAYALCEGDPLVLTVETEGPAMSYQWYWEHSPLPGETEPVLYVDEVSVFDEGYFGVYVEGPCADDDLYSSQHFWLNVEEIAPVIVEDPQPQSACPGEDVRFMVSVQSGMREFITHQWFKDGEPITPDGDAYFLVLRDVQIEDSGDYQVMVANACGTTYSATAHLTVAPATGPPEISEQPDSQTVELGEPATFEVIASCVDDYAWYKDGVLIEGEHSRQLFVFPVTCRDEGVYRAYLTNGHGTTISDPATLTVNGCP